MGSYLSSLCRRRRRRHDNISPTSSHSGREPLLRTQGRTQPEISDTGDLLPPPRAPLDTFANVIAALHAGKLPSQEQVNKALRSVLVSVEEMLQADSGRRNSSCEESRGRRRAGEREPEVVHREFEESGGVWRRVLLDVREACQAVLEFGLEKNDDDRIQDLIYQLHVISSTSVRATVAAETAPREDVDAGAEARELPTQEEITSDAAALFRSLYTLAYLLATSTAFRLILSDLMLVARETVADAAVHVEQVAATVEHAMQGMNETVRPRGGSVGDVKGKAVEVSQEVTNEVIGEISASERDSLSDLAQQQSQDEIKATVMLQLQEVIAQAHRQPSFRAALQTILSLTRKYVSKMRTAATAATRSNSSPIKFTPLIWTEPEPALARALSDLQVILERLATGYTLTPVLEAFRVVMFDLIIGPHAPVTTADADAAGPTSASQGSEGEGESEAMARKWFSGLGRWLDHALADPTYGTSETGRMRIGQLYDLARGSLDSAARAASHHDAEVEQEEGEQDGARWIWHVRTLLQEVDVFVERMKLDRTTRNLVRALENLAGSLGDALLVFRQTALGVATTRAKREAVKGLTLWLLPRVLRAMSAIPIPMPRVEYVNDKVEVAVGGQLLDEVGGPTLGSGTLHASLLPDRVRLESWNEVVLELDNTAGDEEVEDILPAVDSLSFLETLELTGAEDDCERGVAQSPRQPGSPPRKGKGRQMRTTMEATAATRAHLHIEGVRFAAHGVAYYAHYKGARWCGMRIPCTSYEDEGLLSVDVGNLDEEDEDEGLGTGLNIDVELEFDTGEPQSEQGSSWASVFALDRDRDEEETGSGSDVRPLFQVTDVHVDVQGLRVSLEKSRHWILNSLFLAPLAGPTARAAVTWTLRARIRTALEGLAEFGGKVRARVHEQKEKRRTGTREEREEHESTGMEDWWQALLREMERLGKHREQQGDTESDEDEQGASVETRMRATMQGIVHTTITRESQGTEPEETTVAVGIGAQILPGKGGPYGSSAQGTLQNSFDVVQERVTEEVRGAGKDVARMEGNAEERLKEGVEQAVRIRQDVEDAGAREEVRVRVERRRRGWRSDAFDL